MLINEKLIINLSIKYFFKKNNQIVLEAANPDYESIKLDPDQVSVQGKLLAVWRKC